MSWQAQRARQEQKEREEYLERQKAYERQEAEKRRLAAEQEAARLRVSGAMNSDNGPYIKYQWTYLSYNKEASIRNNALGNTLGVWWPLGGRLFFLDTDFNWGFGLKTNTDALYSSFGSTSYSITSTGTGGGFLGGGLGLKIALVNNYESDFTWLVGSNFCLNYNIMPGISINENTTTFASHPFNTYWEMSSSFAFKKVYFKIMLGVPRNTVDGNLSFTDQSTTTLPYSHSDKFFGFGIGFK